MTTIVPLAKVEVRKRQRTSIPPGHVQSLKESILARTNLHPPVCWLDPETDTWVITVGECRFRAIEAIAAEKKQYQCGMTTVDPGFIMIAPLTDMTFEENFEAELDENIRREPLSWQDRARAYADLHALRSAQNPDQTLADTKRELIDRGAPFKVTTNASEIREAQIIAEHLHNPKVANARNAREAVAHIYKQEEEKIQAALIKRSLAALPAKPDLEVRCGDLLTILPVLEAGTFDLILADPPYGIGASGGGFRARTVHHHNYEDTVETARDVAKAILTEGFRICKPRANLLMFCDIDLFPWLKEAAANMGWTPFRRPLIWQKSESEGLAPWGGSGPRITTEFIFYATKGQRGMTASPVDWFGDKRVPHHERLHAAEKPVSLLQRLIELTTLPGDRVLDPCCGSGSTIVACRESKRSGLGIEKDQDYFNTALTNVHGGGKDNGEDIPSVKLA